MQFAFTEEQAELKRAAKSFLQSQADLAAVRKTMKTEAGYDEATWTRIAQELGLCALTIPEDYDGAGFGYVELCAVAEEMGRALLCSPFFSTVAMATPILVEGASDEQKAALLPEIAMGELRVALAYRDGEQTAELTPEGDGYLLSGNKLHVLDGHTCQKLIVSANTSNGLRFAIVDAEAEGATRTYLPTMDQTRKQAAIALEKVKVSKSDLLPESAGAELLEKTLQLAGCVLAAEAVGGAEACLDMAVEYAKVRTQFNRPIGSFQAIKHKCANMLLQVESARSAAYYANWAADNEPGELASAAAAAQAYCNEAYFRCASENIQIHGGIGFTWEHDAHLYFKRAKSGQHILGDRAFHHEAFLQASGL